MFATSPPPTSALPTTETRAFTTAQATGHAHVSYRQTDYWCRTGLVVPTVRAADGSGTQRFYSRDDVVRLAVVGALLRAGLSLSVIREKLDAMLAVAALAGDTVQIVSGPVTLTVDVGAVRSTIPEPPLVARFDLEAAARRLTLVR